MRNNLNKLNRRLVALEGVLHRPCQTCNDHPIRTVFVDPQTETVWSETYPEYACSECGAVVQRELTLRVSESEDTAVIT